MSFLFLSFFFFFFIFTFKTNSTRIYKAKYDLLLSIIQLRGIPACSSLYPLLFELTEFTIDSFVLDDEMRHAEDDRFFLFSFSLFSLSLSLIYTRIHILSHSLTLRPLFRAFKMKPQGDVIARANTYVERELFTVRMQGKRLGVSQRRSLRYHEESTRKATATSNEKIKDSVDKKRMLVREGVKNRDAHTMVESEAGRNREKDGGIKNG